MWFWLTFGKTKKSQTGEGYFNCPGCGSRQPCAMYQVRSRSYLYGFIPISEGEPVGPESYFCSGCSREYVADGFHGYDFGEHAVARTWRCFKCKKEIDYDRFDCPWCGFRFSPGSRV